MKPGIVPIFPNSFIALAALFVSTPATAQSQIGESGALPIRTVNAARIDSEGWQAARKAAHDFGTCVVKGNREGAKKALSVSVDDPTFRDRLTSVATNRCLADGTLIFPPPLLRGSLFEALYRSEFGRDFAADLSKAPAFDYASGYKRPLSDAAMNSIALAMVADCAARSDPAAARLVVESVPNSSDENLAIGLIANRIGACIPKGQEFRFSRDIIRAATAEAVYRLSEQSRSVETAARTTH